MKPTTIWISEELELALDEIAHARSGPQNTVSRSEIAREALAEYLADCDEVDADVETLARGGSQPEL